MERPVIRQCTPTVPKSYKTNRVIAIEPSWSMFFQKGVGRMIRKRLERFGQLHPDAQERAKNFARVGSDTGLLATLDLVRRRTV